MLCLTRRKYLNTVPFYIVAAAWASFLFHFFDSFKFSLSVDHVICERTFMFIWHRHLVGWKMLLKLRMRLFHSRLLQSIRTSCGQFLTVSFFFCFSSSPCAKIKMREFRVSSLCFPWFSLVIIHFRGLDCNLVNDINATFKHHWQYLRMLSDKT